MRGIQIAVALHMGKATPQAFALVRGQDASQIVQISAFGMRDLAESSILHHSQHHHFGCAITTVLEKHAVLARSFGGIYQFPTLFERRTRRHFDRCVLAVFHHVHRHRDMPVPGCGDVNDIEIELG